ncbi:MAG: 6-bladed beta-propeller, partial [Thermomicrobiales bacterium]
QAGSVYVADTENHRIQTFHDDVYVAKFGAYGNGNGQFNTPLGVAVDLDGRVYVADWGNHRIQVFKPV